MSRGLKIEFTLSKREAEAVIARIKADGLSLGWGVRKSQAIEVAEFKLTDAILRARREVQP
jgi:hypothetical protein